MHAFDAVDCLIHFVMKSHALSLCVALLFAAFPLQGEPPAKGKPAPKITLQVEADYLALHATGSVTAGATAWEQRLTLEGAAQEAGGWKAFPQPAADGSFKFDVPLPDWKWAKLEVRALAGGLVLASAQVESRKRSFVMLTPGRIAALPAEKRDAWQSYLKTSQAHADHERELIAGECRKLGLATSQAAAHVSAEFEMDSDVPAAWYGSAEALKMADAVLSYQTPTGAWSKAVSYTAGPRKPGTHWTINADNPWHYCGTLDNRTTTEQIKFLAHVYEMGKRDDARAGALRGIEWLLMAQFPNGGWPQVYPVEPGYHEAITLNDGAMLHALEVLLAVSKAEDPFMFVDGVLRERAAAAVERGLACLVDCQVRIDGKPTVWCAQHDPLSLEPVAARLKEPPSLSGAESAELLRFLMRKGPITEVNTRVIESGIEWLAAHRVTQLRKSKNAEGKTDYMADPASTEVYWARFYDVKTGLPIFAGAQDGKIYSTFHEMAQHNKVAYDYFTTKPEDVVGKEVERWKKRAQKKGR